MKITKAVVPVAGFGTRFLPVTKTLPKEMLPVVDKPVVQYIVEELVASGITDIIFVTGQNKRAVEDHFDYDAELESWLLKNKKTRELSSIREIAKLANFVYIRQKGPYGNGTPVLNVKHLLGKEPFVYVFSDDLVLSPRPFTKMMIEAFHKTPGVYIGVQEVPKEEVSKYGIIEPEPGKGNRVRSIIEKPEPAAAPSRLAIFGRYLLTPEIFEALEKIPFGKGGELWLADGIEALLRTGVKVYYSKIKAGAWYTTGDPVSYLRAIRAYALARKDYRDQVRDIFV